MDFIMLALQVFMLDQHTKQLAERIEPGKEVVVAKNALSFINIKNKGAAYGFLADNPKTLFAVTLASATWFINEIVGMCKKTGLTNGQKASLACVAGGAAGNIFDRILRKGVTDFIHIKFCNNAPVFNVADIFILFGALAFVFESFSSRDKC